MIIGSDLSDCHLPTVSVVICTYQRPKSLARLLQLLAEQKHTDFNDLEVIIVNDGSHDQGYEEDYNGMEFSKSLIFPDGHPERLADPTDITKIQYQVTYIKRDRHPENRPQVYSSKNIGVDAARNEIIWLLDDDLIVDDHTFQCLRQYHMAWRYDRVVVRPHEANVGDPVHYQAPADIVSQDWTWDKLRVYPSFAGMSLAKTLWNEVGGLDEDYDLAMGFADLDLGIRLYETGANIVQVGGVVVFVEDSETGSHRNHFIHYDGVEHRNGEQVLKSKWPESEWSKWIT